MANYQVVMYTSCTVLLIRDDWVLLYYLSRFSEILMNGMCFPMVKVVTIKDISRFLWSVFKQKDKIFIIFKTMSSAFAKKI